MNQTTDDRGQRTANPTRGKGVRYIYCPNDGKCVDYAARQNWKAFHCRKCETYKNSESAARTRRKKKAAAAEREKGGKRMDDQKKNQLIDLNDHLFDQMDRLAREGMDDKELQKEIHRSKAVSNLAAQIVGNARLALDATIAIKEGMLEVPPQMLGMPGYKEDGG